MSIDIHWHVYDAVLQILNDKNEVIDEWTTDGTVYRLTGVLKAGATYTIHEKTVPKGYQQSKDEQFTVPVTEEPPNITFTNLKQKDDTPKTGDTNHLILYILVAGGMLLIHQYPYGSETEND